MSSLFNQASLVIEPAVYEASKLYATKPFDGSGDLTFTRSLDTATRVGADGLIEKVRTNLVLQSQGFNTASWSATFNGTGLAPVITANNAIAPDGTMTADTIVFNAGAGTTASDSSGIFQVITANGLFNGSFFARVASGTGQLMFRHVGGSNYTTINLTTTYQRFSVAETGATGFFEITIRRGLNEPINASVTAQLWGAQLETGDIATPYIPTTTAAVSVGMLANVPRLDYLGGGCPRLLLEPQRTNLVTFSEQLNTASAGTSAVTANTQVSPDGFQNADTIGAGYWTKSTSQASGTYTLSVFAKYQSAASVLLYIYDGAYYQGSFNLQTGVATSSTGSPSVSMVNYGNGWYRCIVTATTASTISEVGFGSGNFYGYGLQLELGSYATSYIPTLAAAVTRSADVASKTGISALIGQTEGTLFMEVETIAGSPNFHTLFQVYGDANNRIAFGQVANSTNIFLYINASGVVTFLSATATAGSYKIALAYKSGDSVLYINGVAALTSANTFTFATALSEVFINNFLGTEIGIFKNAQALLFPTRLSNAQLAELTA